jgi:hypothetical protein
MGKRFYGVIVSYQVVNTWYKNTRHPDFDSFIFQQQRDTTVLAKKYYTLIAYPVDANGKILSGAIENLKGTNNEPLRGHLVNHANMKLDKPALDYLYQDGANFDLYINPTHYYKMPNGVETNYMAYEAVTNPINFAPRKLDLNPSPPA